MARVLTPRAEDFPRWYQDLIAKAQLADNGPVRGHDGHPTGRLRHLGAHAGRDGRPDQGRRRARTRTSRCSSRRATCKREAEHVEGFSPGAGGRHPRRRQAARRAGGGAPDQRDRHRRVHGQVGRLATGTCRCCSTSGPTWSAGSCARGCSCAPASSSGRRGTPRTPTEADARAYARRILHDVYEDFMVDVLAIPVVRRAARPARERFAGATNTYTCEGMMGDGKALQMGTSHELGQNFAKAFDITYSAEAGAVEHAWTTSWGISTRMLGGLIMAHGDDNGLRVPPRLAPIQAYVMVVKDGEGVGEAAGQAARRAARRRRPGGARRPHRHPVRPPGRRRRAQGLPGTRRGRPPRPGRRQRRRGPAGRRLEDPGRRSTTWSATVLAALDADQQALLRRGAGAAARSRTVEVTTLAEAIEAAATGWARLPWSAVGAAGRGRGQRPGRDGALPGPRRRLGAATPRTSPT